MDDTEDMGEEVEEVTVDAERPAKAEKGNSFFLWMKNLGLKVKIFFIALIGIVGSIMVFVFSKKLNTRAILKTELKKVRKEIEIEVAAKEIDRNNEKLSELKVRAEEIKKEISKIDDVVPIENPTEKELDDFFDSRGF